MILLIDKESSMSSPTYDHPDIEKLSTSVVNGQQIREIVRLIFREPKNGAPDNISQEGCLALAQKGHEVWNEWRRVFPCKPSSVFDLLYPQKKINKADFSNRDHGGLLSNLQNFNFGDFAMFDNSTWENLSTFDNARFGDRCSFTDTKWGEHNSFKKTEWGFNCRFNNASWGDYSEFSGAKWGGACIFSNAKWGVHPVFFNTTFGARCSLSFCTWDQGASFDGAKFHGGIIFKGSTFEGTLRFPSAVNADTFPEIDFSGCVFKGDVDFGGRKFLSKTNFGPLLDRSPKVNGDRHDLEHQGVASHNSSVIFFKPPNFHGCELNQDTSFEGVVFPAPTGSEEAARAYRTLKLAFSKQQASREENRFFILEMDEEAKAARWLQKEFPFIGRKILFVIYKRLSNYGTSFWKPTVALLSIWLTFACVYTSYDASLCFVFDKNCELQIGWLQYSLVQSLPLPGLDPSKSALNPEKLIPVALQVLHKSLSLGTLFLIGLALRNLFKLK
jgi:hypothetical protein